MGVLYMATQKEILNDLYNGNININEIIPISQEYNILTEESNEVWERIKKRLDDEENELLNKYIEIRTQIVSIECEEKFIEGYKTASKLIIAGIK